MRPASASLVSHDFVTWRRRATTDSLCRWVSCIPALSPMPVFAAGIPVGSGWDLGRTHVPGKFPIAGSALLMHSPSVLKSQ